MAGIFLLKLTLVDVKHECSIIKCNFMLRHRPNAAQVIKIASTSSILRFSCKSGCKNVIEHRDSEFKQECKHSKGQTCMHVDVCTHTNTQTSRHSKSCHES